MIWAAIFLRFGLLPTILLHALFDLTLFSIPLYLVDAPLAWVQRAAVVVAALVPLAIVLWRRASAGAWRELPASLRNGAWAPAPRRGAQATIPRPSRGRFARRRLGPAIAARAGRSSGSSRGSRSRRCTATCRRSPIDRQRAESAADAALARARRDARPRMAANVDGAARERRAAMVAAHVRLARSGAGRLSRAGRLDARTAAVGSPLRDVRRRRRGARRRVAGHDRSRRQRAAGPARAARSAPRRAARERCGARDRRARARGALRRRSRGAEAGRRRGEGPAGAHRLGVHVRGPARRRRQGRRGAR